MNKAPAESRLTRLSLWYPIGYLLLSGLSLIVAPEPGLKLLFSDGAYGPVFPRLAGILIVGLGLIVLQIVRLRIVQLYLTLVWVRVFFCGGWAGLFVWTHDPFFAVLFVAVGLGVGLTTVAHRLDHRGPAS